MREQLFTFEVYSALALWYNSRKQLLYWSNVQRLALCVICLSRFLKHKHHSTGSILA